MLMIPCPKCGAELKLPDRKLLGRKGRCPSCKHAFVLAEPDEVELELAEATPPPEPTGAAVGTGAQWVPDGQAAPTASSAPAAQTAPSAEVQTMQALAGIGEDDAPAPVDKAEPGTSRKTVRRRRKNKQRNTMIQTVAGGVVAVILVAGFFMLRGEKKPDGPSEGEQIAADAKKSGAEATVTKNADGQEVVTIQKGPRANESWNQEVAAGELDFKRGEMTSPTNGNVIGLKFMPTAQMVLHLRPADLWQNTPQMNEFRACLTEPFTNWLAVKIKELTFHEPSQVAELTLGFILDTPGTPAQYTGLVRLKEPALTSTLIQNFGGVPNRDAGYEVYLGEKYAYAIDNTELGPDDMGRNTRPTTFAFAPISMAVEMAEARGGSYGVPTDVQELLNRTDRERHFTAVFVPGDLLRFEEYLFGENLRPLTNRMLNWFGDDVQAVCWSTHLGDPATQKPFFNEVLLRNNLIAKPAVLKRRVDVKLKDLAPEVLTAVRKMVPSALGQRAIIGRFPAMLEAFRMNTTLGIGPRVVQMTTVLPERAGPNLAVGLLLTWDESTRTDFSVAAPVVVSNEPALPNNLAGRLAMQTDVEFARTPIQEAIAYLAESGKFTANIDGDAFKAAGMTKNMPQTFNLGKASIKDGLQKVIDGYVKEGMVVSFDEPSLTITVTTEAAATAKGLPINMRGK